MSLCTGTIFSNSTHRAELLLLCCLDLDISTLLKGIAPQDLYLSPLKPDLWAEAGLGWMFRCYSRWGGGLHERWLCGGWVYGLRALQFCPSRGDIPSLKISCGGWCLFPIGWRLTASHVLGIELNMLLCVCVCVCLPAVPPLLRTFQSATPHVCHKSCLSSQGHSPRVTNTHICTIGFFHFDIVLEYFDPLKPMVFNGWNILLTVGR